MAQLIVRNIDEALVRLLKKRAGERGVSMEEEHRRILQAALANRAGSEKAETFWEMLTAMPNAGPDEWFIHDRRLPGRAEAELNLFEESESPGNGE